MSHSQQMYHTILRRLRDSQPRERLTRLCNVALLVTALYLARRGALTQLADHLLVHGRKDRRGQRRRRFLMNHRLAVRPLYAPTAMALLAARGQARLVLMLDRTTLGNRLHSLTIRLASRGRAVPLAGKVLKKQGPFRRCHVEALLRGVRRWLPASIEPRQIGVVADRAWQDVTLHAMIVHELGWNAIQRLPHTLWLYPQAGPPVQPGQLGRPPGQPYRLPPVRVTRQQAGPAHFLAFWTPGAKEPWYVLSNQPVGLLTLHRSRRRFWTEPMYRDFKSHGGNLAASRITDPARGARLLLGIA